ncbi:MAG: VWA domain-containing protein [Actinophytocola sp.]|uniref:vWA domain-containing protein n=1 Tax=Actinophytocola sp. TaxID=1872138 RepID=UPI00132745B2|nr:VWA domain-containing protein [Actinophytocola sp.]MPZ80377.1 VWA domain-containing protein [Actinophytocola sp.]
MARAVDHVRGFLRELRERGLGVPVPKQRDLLRAMTLVPPRDVRHLYWIARSTLTTSVRDAEIFDPVFAHWFGDGSARPVPSEVDTLGDEQPAPDTGDGEPPDQVVQEGAGRDASWSTVDRRASFAAATDAERRVLSGLRKALPAAVPTIRSRRRRAARRGDRLDVRKVHRDAWRTGGEIITLRWRRPPQRQRPVLVLIDVSGSMSRHSPDYLRFAHAVVGACDRAEVFTFGTTLTHVTPTLRTREVDAALSGLAEVVRDADGGTRIGPSLQDFLGNTRHLRMARGALVLVLSDGLERGDCVPLAKAVRRLSLLGHRLVWWSPLACDPAYRPVTRGMAAVVGHVDALAGVRDLVTARDQLLRGTPAWTARSST